MLVRGKRSVATGAPIAHMYRTMTTYRDNDVEKFFDYHLRAVAARLEKNTERALERQRAAMRDAMHREALLDEKQSDPPRNQ